MKTRVIVLDERPTAKYRWPGSKRLVTYYDDTTPPVYCCLGVVCRLAGASIEDLGSAEMPSHINTTRTIPGLVEFGVSDYDVWHCNAATVNDRMCIDPETRAEGVAYLRKIFRDAGAERGERWIIRWIRDKEAES
jgi:hypothetical protein